MSKELVIIWDTPSTVYIHKEGVHHFENFLEFFERIHLFYWSKEKAPKIFFEDKGKFIFYPYCRPYNSRCITGLKYMIWIGKTLWQICKDVPKDSQLIFMPVMPVWPGLPALIVGKMKRKKVVLRLDAEKINYLALAEKLENRPQIFTFLKVLILKLIYYLTLPFYDFVIAISGGILKEAVNYGAKKVIKIPILINLSPFLDLEPSENKNPVLLYVGHLKKIKGIDNLIKVLHSLKKENKFVPKLLIIGDVTHPKDELFFRELKTLSQGLDVEFLGRIPYQELPKIYQRADIFVSPSLSEALGMSIMEAMASGLPVIASNLSGPRELVEDGKTGFLVEPGNFKALKEKLILLLENSDLRKEMGKLGRQRIQEIMAKAYENNKKLWEKIL